MKSNIIYVLLMCILLIMLNCCSFYYKKSNPIHYYTDGYKLYSSEYCDKLPEDYYIYKKLYLNYDDASYMFKYSDLLDSAYLYCDNMESLLSCKYNLFMTIGAYQSCIDYMQEVPDSIFEYPYNKVFYVNTAQSALNQIVGDTIARNENNKEIIQSILNYWEKEIDTEQIGSENKCCTDFAHFFYDTDFLRYSNTMVMFYVVRARYEDISVLQDEISQFTIKDDMDSIFITNLQQGLQQMKMRSNYHFEHDIIINPRINR